MKLNKEQIAQIDKTLVLNKVVYDDIKLELIDHIASDIEEIMTDEKVSYELAFKDAFEKWEGQLKLTKSWFLDFDSFPKIVSNKLISDTKKWVFFLAITIMISITLLILGLIKIYDSIVMDAVNKIYTILGASVPVLLIISRIVLKKSRIKTTYRSYFEKHSFGLIYMSGIILYDNGFHALFRYKFISGSIVHVFWLFCLTFFLVHAILTFRFLFKHFQFEKKLFKA